MGNGVFTRGCDASQTAGHWLEHGDRTSQSLCRQNDEEQQWPYISKGALDAGESRLLHLSLPSMDPAGTAALRASTPRMPLLSWASMTLSGPPGLGVTAPAPAITKPSKPSKHHVSASSFTSPPLVVLATGEARVARIEPRQQCLMLHSVVPAVTAETLEQVLLEAAALRTLEHPSLLRVCAVVTSPQHVWSREVGLLSELTEGSLAALLDTSPVRLSWANGLLAFATDVAAGLR